MKLSVLLIISVSYLSGCFIFKKNSAVNKTGNIAVASKDSVPQKSSDSTKKRNLRHYNEIITGKAEKDSGLFIIQKVDNRYFFEIPKPIFERDILIVSRIAKAAANNRPNNNFSGYSGDQIGEGLIRFSMGVEDKVFIKAVSYTEMASDSSENGMARALRNSNLLPIVGSFDIKAFSPDSLRIVLDMTDFLNSDNNLLYFGLNEKKSYNLGGLHKDKSYIIDIQSFPVNIELRVVNTYGKGEEMATYELNTSFVLLPENPMEPRYNDPRVGYFSREFIDFDAPGGANVSKMITRWRLEPKESDRAKYLSGQLVEPAKPIIYYIDHSTPKKWVPYLIQGVNDWQRAFEKAGFKNAIYALEVPLNDPEFNLLDARHNAIIYKPSVVANANGPHVSDPRSGEILETHINWYHNIMQLIHDWYMIQGGPNDPGGRKMRFDDTLMGRLIRYVACHEVGHTLGLMHNFGASFTVPVDSLRSKPYVKANGFCPSIMDYARFNYVAQPQDGFAEEELLPKIGVYDEWAIEWGYRWLPELKDREEEKNFMNQWIINSLKGDKRLWYGSQEGITVTDPRRQFEDLGDNAMKASFWGIQNLKRVMDNLIEWTKEPNQDYTSLVRMYKQVMAQAQLYFFHVSNNIGYYMSSEKATKQNEGLINFLPKAKQKEAVGFLQKQLFETPYWLMDRDIFFRVGENTSLPFASWNLQNLIINDLLNWDRYVRMTYSQVVFNKDAYTFDELLTDLEKGIFSELDKWNNIDFYRRNLQRIYVERLIKTGDALSGPPTSTNEFKLKTDFITIADAHKRSIVAKIEKALPQIKDRDTRIHLIALGSRLKNSPSFNNLPLPNTSTRTNAYSENELRHPLLPPMKMHLPQNTSKKIKSCWEPYDIFDE